MGLVVAILIVLGSLYAAGAFTPASTKDAVDITGIRISFLGASCWNETNISGRSLNAGQEFNVSVALAYAPGPAEPSACEIGSAVAVTGGLLVAANTPLLVENGSSQNLRLTLAAPPGSYTGVLSILLTDSWPIALSFSVGDPVPTNTTGSGATSSCGANTTTLAGAIAAGDWGYTLTVETSLVRMGGVLFDVATPQGTNVAQASGFYVVNAAGDVAACEAGLAGLMSSPFGTYPSIVGSTYSTRLSSNDTIFIDMGPANPAGQGYSFSARGQLPEYTGITALLSLP